MTSNIKKTINTSEKILNCFKSLKHFVIKEKLTYYIDELKRIYQAYLKNTFFVVVVGEFSTGKSTLLNTILNTDLLPVGDLPTTMILTQISYGPNTINKILSDGMKEEIHFGKIIGTSKKDDINSMLDIKIDCADLKKTGVCLFDTPGIGDLLENKFNSITNILSQCDGIILTTTAENPLSKTERLFIEQYLLFQKIPHICIVLTKIDKLDLKEQITMIKYVSNQVKKISSQLEFVVATEQNALRYSKKVWMIKKNHINRKPIILNAKPIQPLQVCI